MDGAWPWPLFKSPIAAQWVLCTDQHLAHRVWGFISSEHPGTLLTFTVSEDRDLDLGFLSYFPWQLLSLSLTTYHHSCTDMASASS